MKPKHMRKADMLPLLAKGLNYREIADEWGMSHSYIKQLGSEIIKESDHSTILQVILAWEKERMKE